MVFTNIQTPLTFHEKIQYYEPDPYNQNINIITRFAIEKKLNKGTPRESIEKKIIERIFNIFFLVVKLGPKHQKILGNIPEEKRNKIVFFYKISNLSSPRRYNLGIANQLELFDSSNTSIPPISVGTYDYFYFDVSDFIIFLNEIQRRLSEIYIEGKPNYNNSENRGKLNDLRTYIIDRLLNLMITSSVNEPMVLGMLRSSLIDFIKSKLSKKNAIDKIPYIYVDAFQKVGIFDFIFGRMKTIMENIGSLRINNGRNRNRFPSIINMMISTRYFNIIYFIKFANDTKVVVFQEREKYKMIQFNLEQIINTNNGKKRKIYQYTVLNESTGSPIKSVNDRFNFSHINTKIASQKLLLNGTSQSFGNEETEENEGLEGLLREGGKKKKDIKKKGKSKTSKR